MVQHQRPDQNKSAVFGGKNRRYQLNGKLFYIFVLRFAFSSPKYLGIDISHIKIEEKLFLGPPAAATAAGGRRRVVVSKPKFDIIKMTPNEDVCKKPHLNIFKNTPWTPPPTSKMGSITSPLAMKIRGV